MPDANPGGVTAAYVNRIVDTLKTMQSNGAKQGDMTAYINATGLTIPQLTGQEPIDLGKIAAKGVGAGVAVRERVQSGPAKDQLANLKQFFPTPSPTATATSFTPIRRPGTRPYSTRLGWTWATLRATCAWARKWWARASGPPPPPHSPRLCR